jgi:hypothetical protein
VSERGLPDDLESALSADSPRLALLVFIDWPNDPLYAWSGVGPLSYNGETWTGVGSLANIDKVADSLEKDDIGVELTLNYLDDDLRNEIVTTNPVGVDASIFLALLDSDNQVDEAYEIFPGFVDEISIVDSGPSGSISVRVASELARIKRPLWFQLTDAHQRDLFPGDLGMQFASRMNEPIVWGRKPTNPTTGGGGRPRNPNETWEQF